jgi:hypothetical protein
VDPLRLEGVAERAVERLGLLGRGGVAEARAIALCRVRDQRELADDEGVAAGVEQAAIEPALLVLEDPEASDAAGELLRGGEVVAARDSEEDAETLVDLARDFAARDDAGLRDALDDRSQSRMRLL